MEQEVRIVRAPAVCRMAGFSRSTLRRRVLAGDFPKPVKLGAAATRLIGWRFREVQEWLQSRTTT